MNALAFTHPILSHINSLNTLINPLIRHGFEVKFMASKGVEWFIDIEKTPIVDFGPYHDGRTRFYDTLLNREEFSASSSIPEWFSEYPLNFSISHAMNMCERICPEFIIRSPVELSSLVIATKFNIPLVVPGWSKAFDPEFVNRYWRNGLERQGRKFGVKLSEILESFEKQLVIYTLPETWFEHESQNQCLEHYCLKPENGFNTFKSDGLREVLDTRKFEDIVFLSHGTNWAGKNKKRLFELLKYLDDIQATILVTSGTFNDSESFFRIKNNIHTFQYIPNNLIMPKSSLAVFHAGFNTLHDCVYWGVPCVTSPIASNDQPQIAARINKLQIGKSLNKGWGNPKKFATMIKEVFEADMYKKTVRAFSKSFRQGPSEKDYVSRILQHLVNSK